MSEPQTQNTTQPAAEAPRGGWITRLRGKGYLRPGFLTVVAVLLAAVLGMQTLIWAMGLVLIKKPIALQKELDQLTTTFGPYELIQRQGRLPKAQEEALGTTEYIAWYLRDTRMDEGEPGSVIRLHIPYYTGQIDSVPHVPDRCFVAAGQVPGPRNVVTADLSGRHIRNDDGEITALTEGGRWVSLPADRVPMTLAQFYKENRPSDTAGVAYFFIANHDFVATPEGVRIKAINPFDQHAYWAKIEVMPLGVGDSEQVREIVQEFLSYALPEVMLCLPDWENANRQSEPAKAAMR